MAIRQHAGSATNAALMSQQDEARDDAALIQGCLAGEQRAWDALVERYGRLVYAIPRRMGIAPTDADDIFQNVFAAVLKNLGSLRDQTRLAAWLITTTRRECWRFGRTARPFAELDEGVVDAAAAPSDEVERWEQEERVRHALRQLDVRCRELLVALFFDPSDPGYAEIARRLGIPVGSIGPTRARCFKKLEGHLVALGIDART